MFPTEKRKINIRGSLELNHGEVVQILRSVVGEQYPQLPESLDVFISIAPRHYMIPDASPTIQVRVEWGASEEKPVTP